MISCTQNDLSWTDHSVNETGFKIERSTDQNNWSQIATTAATVATYSNTGLTGGTTCYYRVRAYNSDGDSAYSNVSSATHANAARDPHQRHHHGPLQHLDPGELDRCLQQ